MGQSPKWDATWFEGHWQLDREIREDRGGFYRLEGRATLSRAEHVTVPEDITVLDYHEVGRLIRAGASLQAEQRYRWYVSPGGLEIRYADDRPFVQFGLSGDPATDEHLCGADLYRGTFQRTGHEGWRLDWRVDGPSKAYLSRSRYSRSR
ncbi:MAG: DUF6314 family protein [Pseudomonadota bacterium]